MLRGPESAVTIGWEGWLGSRAWTDGREQGVLRPPGGDGRWKPS